MAPRSSFELNSLSTAVPAVFDQAQSSAATHKKNCVALYKLHAASAEIVESINRGRKDAEIKLVGERTFAEIFLDMLNRVLVVKKSTPAADRIVKFVASYVKFLNEKVSESDEEETPSSRFVARLLRYFLKGFQAKSKEVRFRCLNFVSEIISSLGELDQDLYAELRTSLLERLADKEPLVRVHSVVALSLLAASEDPYDLEDDEPPILNSLLTTLYYDPAAEVRRAALLHIPFTHSTLPSLLTRMRDVDAITRKLVFSAVLPRLANPRQLTIAQREQVASQGLGDRSDVVRVAAAKLLGTWVDACDGDLAAFVSLFDVHTPDVARDALKSVFVTRAEIANEIEFDDVFWSNLKPETALLARTFVEHCISKSDESRLETTLPVVTALAFHLQNAYNTFLALLQDIDNDNNEDEDDEEEAREEKAVNAEFVMGELLRLAVHLDYSDEIGRRKMFGVVRNMLAHPELPEPLIDPCIGVLHIMSPNERDLIRVVVEVISELRDPGTEDNDNESMALDDETNDAESTIATARPGSSITRSQSRKNVHEMTPEEKAEADLTDLRCLNLCIAVLGRIHGSFEENSTLRGVLEELIVPSVQRKELVLREKGLTCLGLCCLIAKNMALSSFQLFLSQIKTSPESLRLKVLQVVFDIMMTYEKDLFTGPESIGERVITFLMQVLEAEESKPVQAMMCLGLAKLMLFGLVTDERVLMSLIFAYISPTNVDNQELLQCLAYFLPVYCYSSSTNQMRLQSVFVRSLDLIFQTHEEVEDDQEMISPLQVGQLLVDWTDPSKVVGADEGSDLQPVHLHLAIDIVRVLYENERADDQRKTLCQLLTKLVFPTAVDQQLLYTLYILVTNLTEICPFEDSSTDKSFKRFKSRFEKHFTTALAKYDEQACFNDPDSAYNEVFEFLGVTRPKQRHFEGKTEETTRSKSVRAEPGEDVSETEAATEADNGRRRPKPDGGGQGVRMNGRNKTKALAPKVLSDGGSSNDENENLTKAEQRSGKHRSSQTRKAKGKSPIRLQGSSSSSSEQEAEDDEAAASDSQSEIADNNKNVKEEHPPILSTPPKRRGAKRLHTPTKSPSMASPIPKRQNRGAARASGKNTQRATTSRISVDGAMEEPNRTTNTRGKAKSAMNQPSRGRRRPQPPKLRSSSTNSDEPDEADVQEEDGSSESQASIPQRSKRTTRQAVPVMEEKIGWDDSSDF